MAQAPIDTSFFASDLVAMITDLPAIAYYSTTSFPISVTQLSNEESLILTGNDTRSAIMAIFPISAIATAGTPGIQSRFAVSMPGQATTANYEVVRRELMEDGVSMRLTLMADNRNP